MSDLINVFNDDNDGRQNSGGFSSGTGTLGEHKVRSSGRSSFASSQSIFGSDQNRQTGRASHTNLDYKLFQFGAADGNSVPGIFDNLGVAGKRKRAECKAYDYGNPEPAHSEIGSSTTTNNMTLQAPRGFVVGQKHSRNSHGTFGLVMNVARGGHVFVAKFFGYTVTRGDPDYASITREIQNLTLLKGIDGVVQIEDCFNDTAEGMLQLKGFHKKTALQNKRFPVIVLEKLTGGTLIDRILNETSQFTEQDAQVIFKQLMEIVREIHDRDVINCDLKVDNIMFAYDSRLKIVDFGMGVFLCGLEEYYSGTLFGTTPFMAPESISHMRQNGQAVYSRKSDIWQAGCILYILLSGHPPFRNFAACDRTFDSILQNCMWKEIDKLEVSCGAKALLSRMLQHDTQSRADAHEVLSHPWMNIHASALPCIDYKDQFSALGRMIPDTAMEGALCFTGPHPAADVNNIRRASSSICYSANDKINRGSSIRSSQLKLPILPSSDSSFDFAENESNPGNTGSFGPGPPHRISETIDCLHVTDYSVMEESDPDGVRNMEYLSHPINYSS
jgi:serine/threonine protein kinase